MQVLESEQQVLLHNQVSDDPAFHDYLVQDEPRELSPSEQTQRVTHDVFVEEQTQTKVEQESAEDGHESASEQQPLLFVDINLGGSEQERIVVFEGDTAA